MSHVHSAECAYKCIRLVRAGKLQEAECTLRRMYDQQLHEVLMPIVHARPDYCATIAFPIALLNASDRVFSITNVRAPWYGT